MAVLATTVTKSLKVNLKPKINWLNRLALLKLCEWRLGNDMAAIDVQLEKVRARMQRVSDINGELALYESNLEIRRSELAKRRRQIRGYISRRMCDSLDDVQYAWWRAMWPVGVMVRIPDHLHYWLGSTEKSPVGYTRYSTAKRDVNKAILWQLSQEYVSLVMVFPEEAYTREFAFNPLCRDVEADVISQFEWRPVSSSNK
jgi:hypothetical protein